MASSTPPPAITLPGVPPEVQDLLLWRDWKKSGAVLGSIIVAWYFLGSNLSPWPVMQLLSLLVGIAVPLFLAWNFAAPMLKKEPLPVPSFFTEGLSKAQIDEAAEPILKVLNPIIGVVGKLVSGKDLKLSGIVTVAAFIAFKIFARISLATLIFLVALAAFSLPKLYEAKKQDIDKVTGIVGSKASELYQEVDKVVFKKISKPPAAAGVKSE